MVCITWAFCPTAGEEHICCFATSLHLVHSSGLTRVWIYETQHFLFLYEGPFLTFSLLMMKL